MVPHEKITNSNANREELKSVKVAHSNVLSNFVLFKNDIEQLLEKEQLSQEDVDSVKNKINDLNFLDKKIKKLKNKHPKYTTSTVLAILYGSYTLSSTDMKNSLSLIDEHTEYAGKEASSNNLLKTIIILLVLLLIFALGYFLFGNNSQQSEQGDATPIATAPISTAPIATAPIPAKRNISSVSTEMGIVTGSESGTYIKIGRNVSDLVKGSIELNVFESSGSQHNMTHIDETVGVQLGIVQSDVLASINKNSDRNSNLATLARDAKMVFPLYNEEIHILAKRSIESVSDLNNKKIAVGKKGSGTSLTASMILNLGNVIPSESVNSGSKEALELLRSGDIDAMFYVAGFPVELLKKSEISEKNWHLVPIKDDAITQYYTKSTIPNGTYSFQDSKTETVAVKAVLMTYNYRGNNCANVGKLAIAIYSNLDWLKVKGHPKWKSVDLDAGLTGWKQYSCVTEALKGISENSVDKELPIPNDMLQNTLKGMVEQKE